MKSRKLFGIAGIDIYADPLVLILVFLLGISFLSQYSFSSWTGYVLGAMVGILLLVCVLIHELSHALVAKFVYHHSVPSITFFILGGATAIDDSEESAATNGLRGELVFTLAGPIASFLIAGFFYIIAPAVPRAPEEIGTIVNHLAFMNIVLGIFNMLPIFPIDGGRIVRSILYACTGDYLRATRFAVLIGKISIVGGLIWTFFALSTSSLVWLGIIAFFLWNGGSAEERALEKKIDERVLRTYVGKHSVQNGEPFVRTQWGEEHEIEIWKLVSYCVSVPREQAVEDLIASFSMSREGAEAAWLFCKWHEPFAMLLHNKHTGAYEEEFMKEIPWWGGEIHNKEN